MLITLLIAFAAFSTHAQVNPWVYDYFPVHYGDEWLYQASTSGITADNLRTVDQTDVEGGRLSYGFHSLIPNASSQGISDDRTREFYSLGEGGLYLDKSFVDPDFGNSYTIYWNGLNLIGPELQVGATKNLSGNVQIKLSILEWNGTGSGSAVVEAQEHITVPAGTFSTYRVRVRYNHNVTINQHFEGAPDNISGSDDTTFWLAEGIGIVKQTQTQTSTLGTQSITITLKSYSISRSLSGFVVLDSENGEGLSGVQVALTKNGAAAGTKNTSSSGYFEFNGLSDGSYTVTPISESFTFAPESQDVILNRDVFLEPFVATVVVNPLPDLLLGVINDPSRSSVETGETLTVAARIDNSGDVATGEFELKIFFSIDQFLDEGDMVIHQGNSSSIGPATTHSTSFDIAVPIDLPPGNYHVGWFLDSAEAVVESDETNNIGMTSITVNVVARPSLQIAAPNGGESFRIGSTQSIRWTSEGDAGDLVKIELIRGGAVAKTLSAETQNDGVFEWPITGAVSIGDDYQVRIASVIRADVEGHSGGTFAVSMTGHAIDALDSDGDGISDTWEDQFGLIKYYSLDALFDRDGDGRLNIDEFKTSRNPVIPDSDFDPVIRSYQGSAAEDLTITWVSLLGYETCLIAAEDLEGPWDEIAGSRRLSDSDTSSHMFPVPGPGSRYYRAALDNVDGEPPVIVRQPASTMVQAGGDLVLSVLATGNPFTTFQWQSQTTGQSQWHNLTSGPLVEDSSAFRLTIRDVALQNSGERYRCLVGNSYGDMISEEATLEVVEELVEWTDLADIRGFLKIVNLKMIPANGTTDQPIAVRFDIKNTSNRRIALSSGTVLGIQQKWIERLGGNTFIPWPNAARDGDRYAATGSTFIGPRDPGEESPLGFLYNTANLPLEAGRYRLDVELKYSENGIIHVIDEASIEFEMIDGQ